MKKTLNFLIILFFGLFLFFSFFKLAFYVTLPIQNKKVFNKVAGEFEIDERLLLAIAKTESSFNEKAKSEAGALGVMQIMPETAQFICEKNGIAFEEEKLFDFSYNVNLGALYFKYLIQKFNDEQTALAAYNAGEGNVSSWLKNKDFSDDNVTLKHIPFKETREYVKKVERFKAYFKIINI